MNKKDKIRATLKTGKTLLLIGIPLCLLAPFIFTLPLGFVDFTNTGPIGDTIGGITAPFINILGAILVFLALKAQIEANIAIQEQIDQQEIDKKIDNESRQLNQYYSNLKDSIDRFRYSNLDRWKIGENSKNILEGSEAIYKMLQDFICDFHDSEEDIKANPKITELISMLEICDYLLRKVNESNIPDRETLWTLTKHQYIYRIFPRLSTEYPNCINKHYCESCQMEHGFPDRISELIKSIYERISNGLQSTNVDGL